jgi:pseudouridine synthase
LTDKPFRLNQAIAKSGLCSRRQADKLIAAGRIKVNGKVVCDFNANFVLGVDRLSVDGKLLDIKHYSYLAMYKPKGVITTCSDERGRQSVIDLLPAELQHLRPVGRLDRDSEGLLLFSNDGDFAQWLTHPSHELEKCYRVTVRGIVKEKDLVRLREGIMLEDGMTKRAEAFLVQKDGRQSVVDLIISEGRNRQVRRMFAQLGYPVTRLIRTSIGRLQLGRMNAGTWRYLTDHELKLLTS